MLVRKKKEFYAKIVFDSFKLSSRTRRKLQMGTQHQTTIFQQFATGRKYTTFTKVMKWLLIPKEYKLLNHWFILNVF